MARKKRLNTSLTLSGDISYTCTSNKDYTDTFTIEQELSNSDSFVKLSGFSKSIGSLSVSNAKAIVIKNESNIASELMIETYDWRDDSDGEDADVQNSIDINAEATGGGATALRHISLLLPAGDFFYLNTNRLLTYALLDKDTLESAAKAPIGQIEIEPKSINSGNEYKQTKAISGTTYGGGSAILVNDGDAMTASDTAMVVDDASWFKDLSLVRERFVNLIFEGAQVIKTILGIKTFPVEDIFKFPKFYQYLSEKDFPSIKFSLKDQKVLISTRKYETERVSLKKELEQAGIDCSIHSVGKEKHTLLADSKSVLDLLADFYGEAPVLENFSLAEKEVKEKIVKKQKEL